MTSSLTPDTQLRPPEAAEPAGGGSAAPRRRRRHPLRGRGPETVRLAAAAVGVAAIVLYLVVAAMRLGYPYALERLEGNSLIEVHRVLTGQQLYPAPTAGYVVDGYPPLYFLVSAGFATVLGTSYLPLRVVSLLSSLAAFAVAGRLVQKETGSRAAGIGAAGVFAATYFVGDVWLDVGRVDSLFLALSVGGLYAARNMKTARGAVAAALLLAGAALTKQTGLLEDVAVLGALLVFAKDRRRVAVIAAAAWAAVTVAANLLIWQVEGRWYLFFVYELMRKQKLSYPAFGGFWTTLTAALGLAVFAAVIGGAGAARSAWAARAPRPAGEAAVPLAGRLPLELLAGFAAMAIEGYTALVKVGGGVNDLLVTYLAVALLAGLALGSRHRLVALLSGMLVFAQAFILVSSAHPATALPSSAARAAGERLAAGMRALGGDPVAPTEPELNIQTGTAVAAHSSAVYDVVRANDPQGIASYDKTSAAAIARRQYSAVITYSVGVPLFGPPGILARYYQECLQPAAAGPGTVLYPVAGGESVSPAVVWIPKGSATCQSVFSVLRNGSKEAGS